jgi:hypothetical protein
LTKFPAKELLVTGRVYVRGADVVEADQAESIGDGAGAGAGSIPTAAGRY